MSERLNRYLARAGVASRRAADELIASGSVRVNGRRPPATGMLVEAGVDRVTVDGRVIEPPGEDHVYLAMNKPARVMVTAGDPEGRTTIFDLLTERPDRRLFSVGRLDYDTRGLILLTDDGELAARLAHPGRRVAKEYVAVVRGIPSDRDLVTLRDGVELDDGRTRPAQVELIGSARGLSEVRITITEGRNRQDRRMFEAIGHEVRGLTRTAFGPIRLGRLHEGGYRRLRPVEIEALRAAPGGGRGK